jgi:hypothetical protein
MNAARIAEIAAAGFTTVSNACDGNTYGPGYNLPMLALADDAGLDAIVADQRTLNAFAGTDVDANLDAVVQDYAGSPALAGYYLTDEPGEGAFGALATVVSGLAARDPAHFTYVNLLPNYASAGQLGTSSYDDYVASFLSTVQPQVFSYDYYPFMSDGSDASGFFPNLEAIRAHAVATHTPFWQFIQAISFASHRATTLAEKLWVGTETLAYGGVGISYFTYWTPGQTSEGFGSALIDPDGNETAQYAEATAINARLSAYGRFLVPAISTGVFHNGALPAGTVPRPPGAPVYLPATAAATVGLFRLSDRDDVYAFIANGSHAAALDTDVYLASTSAPPELLDVTRGGFVPMEVQGTSALGTKVHLNVAAGDGALVHLPGPVAAGAPGAEAFVGTVRSDSGLLDQVDAAMGTVTVSSAGWDTCPAGYALAGHDFQSNGFWLCARNDLLGRTFHVGNVVADQGQLFAVSGGTATAEGAGGWDQCPSGSPIGRRFESNGFWLCLE